MANEGVNQGRRRFLTATTAVVGGAGAVTALVPFIKSWEPSERAKKDPKSTSDQQPKFAQNETRSLKPEWLVVVGICTHLGCSPDFVPEIKAEPFDPEWKGGFFCPCHKSRYDIAGRVFQGVPAPLNLVIPPYKFVDDKTILIGVNPEGSAA
jgi:ubiquinol-cytochrome c reductase iron-sulfur subunit